MFAALHPACGTQCPVRSPQTLVMADSGKSQQLLIQAKRLQHDLPSALVKDSFLENPPEGSPGCWPLS